MLWRLLVSMTLLLVLQLSFSSACSVFNLCASGLLSLSLIFPPPWVAALEPSALMLRMSLALSVLALPLPLLLLALLSMRLLCSVSLLPLIGWIT